MANDDGQWMDGWMWMDVGGWVGVGVGRKEERKKREAKLEKRRKGRYNKVSE